MTRINTHIRHTWLHKPLSTFSDERKHHIYPSRPTGCNRRLEIITSRLFIRLTDQQIKISRSTGRSPNPKPAMQQWFLQRQAHHNLQPSHQCMGRQRHHRIQRIHAQPTRSKRHQRRSLQQRQPRFLGFYSWFQPLFTEWDPRAQCLCPRGHLLC